jgi:organic radical activating enzyme
MYGDTADLEKMKAKSNAISPSFCMAKWLHVSLNLMSGLSQSCYLPLPHKIPLGEIEENPSALHNTQFKKLQRKKMLEGKRPEECQICWDIEDLPGDQSSNRHLRAVETWIRPHFEKIQKLPWNANVNPTYLEVSFSHACNFKCSYCSPHVSSSWEQEIKALGPYQLSKTKHQDLEWLRSQDLLPLAEEKNPYVDAFWKWWPDLVGDLQVFRITGGEPLLAKQTFKLLEWLILNPQPHLSLDINSNLGASEAIINRFIELAQKLVRENKIRHMAIHTSVDTYGAQAEYIRHGLNFSYFEKNLKRFLNEVPNSRVGIMSTFNNLSVVGYPKFIDWLIELRREYARDSRRILLDIPHLTGPFHQSVLILTPDYIDRVYKLKNYMQEGENFILPIEIEQIRRIYEWMLQPKNEIQISQARRDFYAFFSEHDLRRGTDFLKTFPEMNLFWSLCKGS